MRNRGHNPERFYVSTDTAGRDEGARIGVSWLTLHSSDWSGEPLMVVPHADQGRWSAHIRKAANHFRWVTPVTFRGAKARGWRGGPALLLSPPSADVLGWFERSRIVPALCVVQGSRYDTTPWARAHGCLDLTTGRAYPPGQPPDPAVQDALRSLHDPVDAKAHSTSRDVAEAVEMLRALAAEGHRVHPDDLEAWALANNWSLAGAHRLGVHAGNLRAQRDAR